MSEYIFKLPDLGEGTVESEIGEWFVKVGDHVIEEDAIAVMMTDKAAVEVFSPVTGKVVMLAGEPGDMIAVGSPLIVFIADAGVGKGEAKSRKLVPNTPTKPASGASDVQSSTTRKVITSPTIRRRARETGINLSEVTGSGPGGRIVQKDIDVYLQKSSPKPAAFASAEVKIIGLRRVIAERMSTANRDVPHFSYVEEIDVTELEALRKHLNARLNDEERQLTYLPFIGMALVRALKEYSQCNSTFDKDQNLLIRHDGVHLGIATQTLDGLKVPVIRNCESRSLNNLAAEIRRVSTSARDNSIKKVELTGSTITITSLGKLGGIITTPIINIPEVAIIGANRVIERPVVVHGQIVIRLIMNLSSSFDHRFVDGYDAAALIQRIKEMLEHPAAIVMSD